MRVDPEQTVHTEAAKVVSISRHTDGVHVFQVHHYAKVISSQAPGQPFNHHLKATGKLYIEQETGLLRESFGDYDKIVALPVVVDEQPATSEPIEQEQEIDFTPATQAEQLYNDKLINKEALLDAVSLPKPKAKK